MICKERLDRSEFKSYKWTLSKEKDDNKGRLVRSVNLNIFPSDLKNGDGEVISPRCYLIIPKSDYGNHRLSLPSDLEIVAGFKSHNDYAEYFIKYDPNFEKYSSLIAWFED